MRNLLASSISISATVDILVGGPDGNFKQYGDVQLVWDPVDQRCEFPRQDDMNNSAGAWDYDYMHLSSPLCEYFWVKFQIPYWIIAYFTLLYTFSDCGMS